MPHQVAYWYERWARELVVPHLDSHKSLSVLLHLCYRANELGRVWPTVVGQAEDLLLSPSSVKRARNEIVGKCFAYPLGFGGKTGRAAVFQLAGRWAKPRGARGHWETYCANEGRWKPQTHPHPRCPCCFQPNGVSVTPSVGQRDPLIGSHRPTQLTNQLSNQPAERAPHGASALGGISRDSSSRRFSKTGKPVVTAAELAAWDAMHSELGKEG